MALFKGKFDSAKQDWETPLDLFNKLDQEYNFDIDLAADFKNAKCTTFLDKDCDSLSKEWKGRCWLNPILLY